MSGRSGSLCRLKSGGNKRNFYGQFFFLLVARLIPNPTRAALSSMRKNGVQALLMSGQACVLYGAAEFSKDVDFAVLLGAANLAHLKTALNELGARHHRSSV